MTGATRSTMLPSFQQLLGVTPRDGRKTGRRWFHRAVLVLGVLGMLVTVGLLAWNARTLL
ncbi:MAG TPA: hypothetical protein VFH48_43505 [Chloroflexota bacterium]|nr:hypothetical protein [Chloroflexota bacterium]